MRLTTSHCKNIFVLKQNTGPQNCIDNLEGQWQRKMDYADVSLKGYYVRTIERNADVLLNKIEFPSRRTILLFCRNESFVHLYILILRHYI